MTAQGLRIEIVRGYRVVLGPKGRVLGVHATDAKALKQIAAINNRTPRRSAA